MGSESNLIFFQNIEAIKLMKRCSTKFVKVFFGKGIGLKFLKELDLGIVKDKIFNACSSRFIGDFVGKEPFLCLSGIMWSRENLLQASF